MKQAKLDLTKEYKSYYTAKTEPEVVEITEGIFLTIEGKGAPGSEEFQLKVNALYSLAYGIKMLSGKEGKDFTVAKLEGLWWVESDKTWTEITREEWKWKLLIRLPEFVTSEIVEKARQEVIKKKKIEAVSEIKFEKIREGKCIQILHIGPYSTEAESIVKMRKMMEEKSLVENGRHHEIYMVSPGYSRKVPEEKWKTILRQPVKMKKMRFTNKKMQVGKIIQKLESLSNPKAIEGMKKFGITPEENFGVSIPNLRKIAKEIGKDHELAQQLWEINIRETRILASMIDDPALVTEKQMEKWVKEFDYWEICDQVCQNLFACTKFANQKAIEWGGRDEEFVKRAGFALMAWLAFKDKKAKDEQFEKFLPIIKREATDNRNFVKKAVNWALRQIGKRNLNLNKEAIELAREIQKIDSKSAKWIAKDALRELTSKAIQERLKERGK